MEASIRSRREKDVHEEAITNSAWPITWVVKFNAKFQGCTRFRPSGSIAMNLKLLIREVILTNMEYLMTNRIFVEPKVAMLGILTLAKLAFIRYGFIII